jgi:hypothetical protein
VTTLREVLDTRQVRLFVEAISRQEVNAAFGACVCEAPVGLPARPGDGSVTDALLSPQVVAHIRGMAREQVAKQRRAMKGVMEMRKSASSRPSLEVLEATGRAGSGRLSRGGRAFLEGGRQAMIDGAPPLPGERSALQIVEALTPAREDGRELDRYGAGGGVVEAATAAVPPAERGWRELMLARGCGRSVEALENPGRDWSGGDAA